MRKINFFDGVTTGTPPTIGNIVASDLVTYANDAAYEAGELGSPTEGNVYFNTTLNLIRYYNGTSWISLVDESSTQTLTNKSISGSTNTLTNLDGDNVVVDAISGLTATDAQDAFAEHQGDIDSLVTLSGVSGGSNDLGTFTGVTIPDSSTNKQALQALETEVELKLDSAEKGAINGVATLDGTGKIPSAQMPWSVMVTSVAGKIGAVTLVAADVTDFDTEVANNTAVTANTAKVSADGSIDTHSDVDTSTVAPTDTQVLTWVSANSKWEPKDSAGGGSGQGGINYITNYDAEVDTAGWSTYKDAAQATPVDGTGGSPTITWTRTTYQPLRGSATFLLTKIAGSQQGEGAAYDFTIDTADKAKVLQISAEYIVGSGTFVAGSPGIDSDVTVWIYDITNATLIQPSSYKFWSNSATISDKFSATFQSASNSTSYRLLFHIASSSGNAYQLQFDDISVSPSNYVFGTPITDWQSFTPTGFTSANGVGTGKWRRVGDSMEVKTSYEWSGAAGAFSGKFNLPSGYTIDTAKLPLNTVVADRMPLGGGSVLDNGVLIYDLLVIYNNTTSVSVFAVDAAGTYARSAALSNTVPMSFSTDDTLSISFSVPILGWSSSVQTSDSADTRVVAFRASGVCTGTLNTSFNQAVYPTTVSDTHNGYSGGTYTIPTSGFYDVTAGFSCTGATVTQGHTNSIQIQKDSTAIATQIHRAAFTSANATATNSVSANSIYCNAGETIKIASRSDYTTPSYATLIDSSEFYFSINQAKGPSAIAASESVNARYTTNAGQSIPNSTTTIIDFGTKDFDSHGGVTTGASWKFTAAISGVYRVSAKILFASTTNWTDGESVTLVLFRNGSTYSALDYKDNYPAVGVYAGVVGSDTIRLNADEYIDVRINQTSGGALSIYASTDHNYCSIERIGN